MVLALLGFLAAAFAATATKAVRTEHYTSRPWVSPSATASSATPIRNFQAKPPKGWNLHVPWWLVHLALELVLAVAVVLAIVLIVRRIPRLGRRRYRPVDALDGNYAPEESQARMAREVTAAVDDALARFRQGDRERAVISCWIRLEQIAEQAGASRRRSETSSELATRWQSQLPVSREPLQALAELYREARYSSHPVSDEAIETARRALEQLRREITAVRPEPAPTGPEPA